jgi:hypothetical protein
MNTMSTFQSLTVHCARCHDHKFDPISQEEYYGLQAVFAGVDRADRPFDPDPEVAARRNVLMSERKQVEVRQKQLNEIIARITSPDIERLDSRLRELKQQLAGLPKQEKDSPGNGYHSGIESRMDVLKWVQVDLGGATPIDEVRMIPARPTDFPDTPGFGFPRRFRVEASDDQEFGSRITLLDATGADHANPGDNPVVAPVKGVRARFVRVTATRLWERTKDYVFALGELQVLSGNNNLALGGKVTALDSIEAGRWGKQNLVDNFDSRKSLVQPPEPFEITAKRQSLEAEIKTKTDEREASVQALLDVKTRADLAEVTVRLEKLRREIDALPRPQTVYAATSDFKAEGSFVPSKGPRPIHTLKRGDVKRPGALMGPATLSCVPGLNSQFELGEPDNEGRRRVALAAWISDPRNMLTRRSIVNRVWQYHFGRGIVDTANDFGHMGSLPTHPELLDWLAYWFLDHGESLKQLHRLIVTSATYRQKSDHNTEFARLDSDNRYLWRMNRQRLDAESFHDTLLFLGGRLDLAMAGPSVQQFFFKDDHSPTYDYTRFDADSPASTRRSVYRFIVRSVPDPFMECLDGADPSLLTAKRNVTLTALQALSTLNDPFVVRQCECFAGRLQQLSPDLPKQIEEAYRLALSRSPRPDETQRMRAYSRKHGLANTCRVLLNSSEFAFVD